MIPVSVLVPTFRRPDSLVRALDSLARQTRAPDEIIVADNAPEAGARRAVETFAGRAPCPVVYVHAANPGVANARNTGFAAARHALIAQLDDDESAGPDWLAQLLAMREATGAAVANRILLSSNGGSAWKDVSNLFRTASLAEFQFSYLAAADSLVVVQLGQTLLIRDLPTFP